MKSFIKNTPLLYKSIAAVRQLFVSDAFLGSRQYWERRYRQGGDSGVGSYGKFAEFKAEVLNDFVIQNHVSSVIEFGHGDGNQLLLANYPNYMGFDVSHSAVNGCRKLFCRDPGKKFFHMREYHGQTCELSLSLDVIYHLIENKVYQDYMCTLFSASTRYVIIYSSNSDNFEEAAPHVRHRHFTRWIEDNIDGWTLFHHIPNRYPYRGNYLEGSFADFYFYSKN